MSAKRKGSGDAARDEDEVREVAARVARLDAAIYKRFHAGRTQVAGEVTPRMVAVLRHLAVSGPLTVGEQADHLGLSRAAMTELVDRLEARGLVARMRDDEDRRRVFVWLTPDGQDHVAGLPDVDDPLVRAVAAMTETDRRKLITGMEALLAAADDRDERDVDATTTIGASGAERRVADARAGSFLTVSDQSAPQTKRTKGTG